MVPNTSMAKRIFLEITLIEYFTNYFLSSSYFFNREELFNISIRSIERFVC